MPIKKKKAKKRKVNFYQQLTGNQSVSVRSAVSVDWSSIELLHGIAWSLDPSDYREDSILGRLPQDVSDLYKEVIEPCLRRNATLNKAEVRDNGEGLDLIQEESKAEGLDLH